MKNFFNTSQRAMKLSMLTFAAFFVGIQSISAQTVTPTIRIVLPERFRVLTNQYFDLRVEGENLVSTNAKAQITILNASGQNEPINYAGQLEATSNNDSNPNNLDAAITYRKVSFTTPGIKTIRVVVTDGTQVYGSQTQLSVQDFNLQSNKNIVLFIGDAMGTAYRDASRIVAQSTAGRFREGWFDDLQQMDKMPVTGMSMTYSLENLVPDSANTASAWANGNKTINGALNVFPDNNDFRYSAGNLQATKQFALDNPRVETLWQFLKRRYNYKTGIVTTSDVTDATPAGEGAHTITRSLLKDIAKQYVDGTINSGNQFDVIMGGGLEQFTQRTAANSGDTRNLLTELTAAGFTSVANRSQLNAVNEATPPSKLIGLFRTTHMNVAYDRLGLARPIDEPAPDFGGFPDQPFLDEMTRKAISVLSNNNSPFILMVEGASIDKQSHPNYSNGQIWDTIEFDKAIGVARTLLYTDPSVRARNLLIATADHDQSMSIIGAVDTNVVNSVQTVISTMAYSNGNRPGATAGSENRIGETGGFPDYQDSNGDRYPENTNRIKIKVGYRTGDHTGSSVPVTAEGAGAGLFYGYYDETDLFFKMAKVLSINTQTLDANQDYKKSLDVPYFTPNSSTPTASKTAASKKDGSIIWLKNAPIFVPGLITDEQRADHDEEHQVP